MSYYDNERRGSWRDVMQVCLAGHVINNASIDSPEYNKDFCTKCGQKTITKCPVCSADIPGYMHTPGVSAIYTPVAPEFCQKCGKPYPWKRDKSTDPSSDIDALTWLQGLLVRFDKVSRQLRQRHDDRETLNVSDEYDVQDLLYALLRIKFNDIRQEEWTPSYAGSSARMDFLLKDEKIVVEVKMTRKSLKDKELGDQLLVDIDRYKQYPDCKTLLCFVYDPEGWIKNPMGLKKDLEKKGTDGLKVIFISNP